MKPCVQSPAAHKIDVVKVGMVACSCNLSTLEVVAGSEVSGHFELHSETSLSYIIDPKGEKKKVKTRFIV